MTLRAALSLYKTGRLGLLWQMNRLLSPFYRLSFVASAASSGLLAHLAGGARPFAEIADELAPNPSMHNALRAWLDLGSRLGELEEGPFGYRLKGYLSRLLAQNANDDVAALVEEVAFFHHRLLVETPSLLKSGAPRAFKDHDGRLIARSSRILEPFLFRAIDWAFPSSGPVSLLEIGAGSGTYMLYAAAQNPGLSALGIELDASVAESAAEEIKRRGLEARLSVITGDIRAWKGQGRFDIATLHNAIYYFPVNERVPLLKKVSSLLKPGGRLLLCSSCKGGSPGMSMLDLWCSSTEGLGPLPTEEELIAELSEAGFRAIKTKKIIPAEPYIAVVAERPI